MSNKLPYKCAECGKGYKTMPRKKCVKCGSWAYVSPITNPKKYDIRPHGKYIRERQISPKKCIKGSYVTKVHPSGHAVVLCKTKESFPKLTLQSILHPLSEKKKFDSINK